MRGITHPTRAAGPATLALALAVGLTACTGDADGRDGRDGRDGKATACTDGTYAWSGVRRSEEVVSLADPITFEKTTAYYLARLEPLDDAVRRPEVTGAPAGVGAARVIKALGTHLKVGEPLAGPSETAQPDMGEYYEAAFERPKGSYYSWGWVGLVKARFTYTCGNEKPVTGRVLTWGTSGSAFHPCSDVPDRASAHTAARMTCPPGSLAAKAA